MMRKLVFIFAFVSLFSGQLEAQQVMSLQQCLDLGIENNLSLESKRNEIKKGRWAISENRARLLPVIQGFAGFNDNVQPPVSVTDGSDFGRPYNVTKTLPFSANAGIQIRMPLYNQTLYTSMDIVKLSDKLNRLGYEKAREELIMQLSKLYYLGQTTSEQLEILKKNIGRLEELKNITVAFYDNDMVMEIDVKRVQINLDNMKVQKDNAEAMLAQQMNLLKYLMDYPAEKDFLFEKMNVDELVSARLTGVSEDLPEIRILESKSEMAKMQKKMIRQGYIPSLALTGNLSASAFTDQARFWFKDHPSNKWYSSYGFGVSLNVPIFDGLEKRSKMRKAELDVENARLAIENLRKNLQTNYLNATNDLKNSERNFFKQKDNYLLAEDVYAVTVDRYKEGIASMTEVLQDEMRMSEAQNNYVTAHYNYQVNNLVLLQLTGKLDSLTNKQ